MAQAQVKDFNNLSKGFTTEASPLTFPEEYTVDENNCIIASDGSRQRRKGLKRISDAALDNYSDHPVVSYVWSSPGGVSNKEFLVIYHKNDIGGTLYIYDSIEKLYDNATPETITLWTDRTDVSWQPEKKPPYSTLTDEKVSFSDIYGYLLVGVEGIHPYAIKYNPNTDEFTRIVVTPFIRDFAGRKPFDDHLTYNLENKGWVGSNGDEKYSDIYKVSGGTVQDAYFVTTKTKDNGEDEIDKFTAVMGREPDQFDRYQLGLRANSSGDFVFNKNEYQSNKIGSSETPNGKFIYKIDQGDIHPAPSVVGAYAGRAWYGAFESGFDSVREFSTAGAVFFSQIVDETDKLPRCFQEADPTSEELSDLIASDGGMITIAGCGPIIALEAMLDSLLVFAKNGVWEIRGGAGGFTALEYETSKITSKGALSPQTVANIGNAVVYMSFSGIHVITYNENGISSEQDIALPVIKEFYNEIPDASKKAAQMYYDDRNAEVRVAYSSDYSLPYAYDRELVYSMRYEAFTKNSYDIGEGYLRGYIRNPRNTSSDSTEDVTTTEDEVVTTTDDENVTIEASDSFSIDVGVSLITANPDDTSEMLFCELSASDFLDLGTYDYESFLLAGYNNFGDTMRNKQIVYMSTHFYKTEDGFEEQADGGLNSTNQSSCLVQVQWNYHNSSAGNRWSPAFQGYRYRRPYTPSGTTDPFDTGHMVITTKNKIRGFGSALAVKFTSETGKDFRLIGWGMSVEGRGIV